MPSIFDHHSMNDVGPRDAVKILKRRTRGGGIALKSHCTVCSGGGDEPYRDLDFFS